MEQGKQLPICTGVYSFLMQRRIGENQNGNTYEFIVFCSSARITLDPKNTPLCQNTEETGSYASNTP